MTRNTATSAPLFLSRNPERFSQARSFSLRGDISYDKRVFFFLQYLYRTSYHKTKFFVRRYSKMLIPESDFRRYMYILLIVISRLEREINGYIMQNHKCGRLDASCLNT